MAPAFGAANRFSVRRSYGHCDSVAHGTWRCVLREVVVMDFDALADRTQRLRDDFPAERAIDEENPGLRQPRGSLS